MSGPPPPPPSTAGGGPPDDALPSPATLASRLAESEAALARTRTELEAARRNAAAQDAARRPTLTPPPVDNGAGGGGSSGAGGTGAGGSNGAPPPPVRTDADGALATGAGGGAAANRPFVLPTAPPGARPEDYANLGDGEGSESAAEWYGARGAAQANRGGLPRYIPYADDATIFNDGFDTVKVPAADEWLQAFDIPRSILRPDGMPIPFTPDDNVHTATFHAGSRDEIEARHWYCSLAWAQQLHNDVPDAKYNTGRSDGDTAELLTYILCGINRLYAIGVSRYDYLALKLSEPALAEAFAHSDAVPRNTLRGDGARRYLSRVVRQETHATAKLGAAERGFGYSGRPQRVANSGGASGSGSGRSGGAGGNGSAGGSGGGAGGGGGGGARGGGQDRPRGRGGRGGRGGSRA